MIPEFYAKYWTSTHALHLDTKHALQSEGALGHWDPQLAFPRGSALVSYTARLGGSLVWLGTPAYQTSSLATLTPQNQRVWTGLVCWCPQRSTRTAANLRATPYYRASITQFETVELPLGVSTPSSGLSNSPTACPNPVRDCRIKDWP